MSADSHSQKNTMPMTRRMVLSSAIIGIFWAGLAAYRSNGFILGSSPKIQPSNYPKTPQKPPIISTDVLPEGVFLFSINDLKALKESNTLSSSSSQGQALINNWYNATVCKGRPGSLMKIPTALLLAQHFPQSLKKTYPCTGTELAFNHPYHCQQPHGSVHLISALGNSCNCYFAHRAHEIPISAWKSITETLFSMPKGNITDHGPSSDLFLGLSPSLELSAAQILNAIALCAIPPHGPNPLLELSPLAWAMVQRGMRWAARSGTAQGLDPKDQWSLAAKTGTTPITLHPQGSSTLKPEGKHFQLPSVSFQSWVTGFYPVHQPTHVFCVRGNRGTSQDTAVPLAHRALFS